MAGYKAKKKTYRLVFAEDQGDLAGLEVTMSSVSTGHLLKLQKLGAEGAASKTKLDPELFQELVTMFADAMIEWNLVDDDDQPIAPTVGGVLTQEPDLIMAIISAWTTAIAGVPAPLDDGSTSGPQSLEASMQMDTLSPSPSS